MHVEFSGSFPDYTFSLLSLFANLKLVSVFYLWNVFSLQVGEIHSPPRPRRLEIQIVQVPPPHRLFANIENFSGLPLQKGGENTMLAMLAFSILIRN